MFTIPVNEAERAFASEYYPFADFNIACNPNDPQPYSSDQWFISTMTSCSNHPKVKFMPVEHSG